ncbi:RNA polymerase sigma factor [Corynebacterium sp.]|uniref:RNA polymerase sigma factor n=1 Tax=Corynebacterium sp. TaxID=1720 RepID=UPI0026DC73ED|nr:sigma-70 family RNA polymerase sigma factor [Corynebacterium sp.]MDO5032202.1 sigma-70 family RNA polymerase sigma factor [Corynebacterium sp.]
MVDAFIEGDTKAFSAIVERHRKRLTTVARRYTRNDHDAQDIVQEALLRASCSMDNYRGESTLSTWLHRLVMNSGYDFLNHRANRELASLDADIIDPDRNYALAHNPSDHLAEHVAVTQAMATLREDQREALLLTDVAGYPIATVAEVQGVAPGTIKSRRARAREVLRAAIASS